MKKLVRNLIYIVILLAVVSVKVKADGFIVIRPPAPVNHPFPLEVVYHKVDVIIDNQTAVTSIDQSFYNPTHHQLEGFYIFPIPKGAVIKDFQMEVNGKMTKAELMDSEKARRIYEDIVRRMRDPALLEYSEQGVYSLRIFPIEPRSEKEIKISYTEVIETDNNLAEYLYPLNTEKFSAKPLKNVSINLKVESKRELKTIYSPTHDVDVIRKSDSKVVISYEEENVKPDIDFKLYLGFSKDKIGLSLLTYKEDDEDGFFLLSASPSVKQNANEIEEKDVTFILDVSGSMTGKKIKQAKDALTYCVNNLKKNDRFEIVKFSTEAYTLFNDLKNASGENKTKAEKFIDELEAVGGTNIEEAFQLAFKNIRKSSRPHFVIFLTDGKPTIGEMDNDKLLSRITKANQNNSRIFTFGIGNKINIHLLDKITEATSASRTYISPDEDIEVKVSNFFDKISSPILTDIEIDFGSGIEIYNLYPKNLPDLFKGSNLLIFGRYKKDGGTKIRLSGKVNGQSKSYTLSADLPDENMEHKFVPSLWAARRVGYLLDLIRLNGESKELVDEVTQLAREFGIITPYTSYLIMEDEVIRRERRELAEDFQTLRQFYDAPNSSRTEYKEDYDAMYFESGEHSSKISEEVQDLNSAKNYNQTKQGSDRLDYKDKDGVDRNLTQQVKNVLGRAVYQNEKFWVDSELQNSKTKSKQRIQFNSDEYFKLLNEKLKTSQFLALGKNVRFVIDDIYYEVYE